VGPSPLRTRSAAAALAHEFIAEGRTVQQCSRVPNMIAKYTYTLARHCASGITGICHAPGTSAVGAAVSAELSEISCGSDILTS